MQGPVCYACVVAISLEFKKQNRKVHKGKTRKGYKEGLGVLCASSLCVFFAVKKHPP